MDTRTLAAISHSSFQRRLEPSAFRIHKAESLDLGLRRGDDNFGSHRPC